MDEQQMLQENMRLVHMVAGRYTSNAIEYEDLVQTGSIGLLKAIRTYKADKSQFSTYAVICISNEINTEIRKFRKQPNIIPIEVCDDDSDSEYNLLEVLLSADNIENDICVKSELKLALQIILNELNPFSRTVYLHYTSGKYTQTELMNKFKIKRSRTMINKIYNQSSQKIINVMHEQKKQVNSKTKVCSYNVEICYGKCKVICFQTITDASLACLKRKFHRFDYSKQKATIFFAIDDELLIRLADFASCIDAPSLIE